MRGRYYLSLNETFLSIWFMHEFYHLMFFIVNTMHSILENVTLTLYTTQVLFNVLLQYAIYQGKITHRMRYVVSKVKDIIMNGCWVQLPYPQTSLVKSTRNNLNFRMTSYLLMTRFQCISLKLTDDIKCLRYIFSI